MFLTWSNFSSSFAKFRFEPNVTPLSSFSTAIITCIAYLTIIFVLKGGTYGNGDAIKGKRKPWDLKKLVIVYNFMMSFLSGVLFLVLVTEMYHRVEKTSMMDLFCDPYKRNAKGLLTFCYYVNYIFKYVELLDTIFLCLRQKDTPFIHVYHHAITLMLCWTQLTVQTCMQWVLISINLFVHVFLYCYYALYELRVDIWWKKYLTTVQIIQFCIALLASVAGIMVRGLYDFTPRQWGLGAPCTGSWSGSYFGIAVIISYLYLFIDLYKKKYNSTKSDKKSSLSTSDTSRNSKLVSGQMSGLSSTSSGSNVTASSVVSSLSLPCLSCGEDSFSVTRTEWLNHPLQVADRHRWEEFQHRQKTMKPIQEGTQGEQESESESESHTHSNNDSTITKRFNRNSRTDLRL